MLNIMLRDVFLIGLRDKAILDRLFEDNDIDLDKSVIFAVTMEKANEEVIEIIEKPQEIKMVNVGNRKN